MQRKKFSIIPKSFIPNRGISVIATIVKTERLGKGRGETALKVS